MAVKPVAVKPKHPARTVTGLTQPSLTDSRGWAVLEQRLVGWLFELLS